MLLDVKNLTKLWLSKIQVLKHCGKRTESQLGTPGFEPLASLLAEDSIGHDFSPVSAHSPLGRLRLCGSEDVI